MGLSNDPHTASSFYLCGRGRGLRSKGLSLGEDCVGAQESTSERASIFSAFETKRAALLSFLKEHTHSTPLCLHCCLFSLFSASLVVLLFLSLLSWAAENKTNKRRSVGGFSWAKREGGGDNSFLSLFPLSLFFLFFSLSVNLSLSTHTVHTLSHYSSSLPYLSSLSFSSPLLFPSSLIIT